MAAPPRAGRRAVVSPQSQEQPTPSLPASLTAALGGSDDSGKSTRIMTTSHTQSPVAPIPLSSQLVSPLRPDTGSFGSLAVPGSGSRTTPTPRQGRRGASPIAGVAGGVPPLPLAASVVSFADMSQRGTPSRQVGTPVTGRSSKASVAPSEGPSWLSDSEGDDSKAMTPSASGRRDSPEPFVSPQTHSAFSPTPQASPVGGGRRRFNADPTDLWNDNDQEGVMTKGNEHSSDESEEDDGDVDELDALFGDSTVKQKTKKKKSTAKKSDADAMRSHSDARETLKSSTDELPQAPPQPSVKELEAELMELDAELAKHESRVDAIESEIQAARVEAERKIVTDK